MNFRNIIVGAMLVTGTCLLCACSGEDKPQAGVAGSSRSENGNTALSTADESPSEMPSDSLNTTEVDASLQELSGAIVYLQGDTLTLLKLGEASEPTVLAEDVLSETIAFAPNNTAVIFESGGNLYSHRADNDEPTDLGMLQFNNAGTIDSWSPNGEWFIRRIGGTILYHVEGIASYDLSGLRIGNTYRWTTDNQLIIIEDNGRTGENFAYRQVNLLNLATGRPETIDIDLESVTSSAITIDEALAAVGYELVPTFPIEYPRIQAPREVFELPLIICNTWNIVDGAGVVEDGFVVFDDTEMLYQSSPIYMLTDLYVLSEDELLFLKWSVEDCTSTNDPVAALVRYQISTRQEEILASTVFPNYPPSRDEASPFFGMNRHGQRFAVSPDGQSIMWLGGSIESGVSSLNLFSLVTHSNTVIFETESGSNVSNFVNHELLSEVYWLKP